MFNTFIDILGAIGCLLILFAFYKTTVSNWTGKAGRYQLANLLGALLLILYSFEKSAYVNVALNLVWLIVAVKGLTAIASRRAAKFNRRKIGLD